SAMAQAATIPGLNLIVANNFGDNAMHLAALSGSASAMAQAATIPGLNLIEANNFGNNAMHLAALSESANAIGQAVKISILNLIEANTFGKNAMHWAARSKKPEAIIFIRRLSLTLDLGFDINMPDGAGHSALWHINNVNDAVLRNRLLEALTSAVEPLDIESL